tara:strand:- start:198 stop:434 length:237 start_codon:yes stop_codon:yes gene_type:complete
MDQAIRIIFILVVVIGIGTIRAYKREIKEQEEYYEQLLRMEISDYESMSEDWAVDEKKIKKLERENRKLKKEISELKK